MYRVQIAPEQVLWAEIRGSMRKAARGRQDFPAVGDWVLVSPQPGIDRLRIEHLLNRKSCLKRKQAGEGIDDQILAANVDTGFVVTSANAEFNVRRIQRYLTVIQDGGATAVVLLTKIDLTEDQGASYITELKDQAPSVAVIAMSTPKGLGLDQVREYLKPGQSVVLLGSSGVGKSTLANALLENEVLEVGEIRADDSKGRHTTTRRQLFQLSTGALLIDTPGMREIHLTDHDTGVAELYDEVEALTAHCKFSNCQHSTEPGCAIRSALSSGALTQETWAGYEKLKREAQFRRRKEDPAEAAREKNKWKKIHKEQKANYKARKKDSWDK